MDGGEPPCFAGAFEGRFTRELEPAGTLGENPLCLLDLGGRFGLEDRLHCARCDRSYPVAEVRVLRATDGTPYFELHCATERCPGDALAWEPAL